MFDKNNKNGLLDEHLTDVLDLSNTVDRYIWVRAVVFLVIGGLVGGISVSFRPYFEDGVHLEAVAALIILIVLNIGLLLYFVRNKRKRYKLAYGLTVCAVWFGYGLGWFLMAERFFDDVIGLVGMFTFVNLIIGYTVFYVQKNERLMKALKESISFDPYIWNRAIVLFIIGTLVGGISVSFRPYFEDGVQLEAIAALIILLVINIGLLLYFVRKKEKQSKLSYSLSVCALWFGYGLGWLMMTDRFFDDFIWAGSMFVLFNLIIGHAVFYLQKNERLMKALKESIFLDAYIWIRAIVFLIIGTLVGVISVSFRPYFEDGVHLEAIAALIILIVINSGLLFYFVRQKGKRSKLSYSLSVCAIWFGYTLGWIMVAEHYFDDILRMGAMFAFVNLLVGHLAFFVNDKVFDVENK